MSLLLVFKRGNLMSISNIRRKKLNETKCRSKEVSTFLLDPPRPENMYNKTVQVRINMTLSSVTVTTVATKSGKFITYSE
jgi:hypothetical protein